VQQPAGGERQVEPAQPAVIDRAPPPQPRVLGGERAGDAAADEVVPRLQRRVEHVAARQYVESGHRSLLLPIVSGENGHWRPLPRSSSARERRARRARRAARQAARPPARQVSAPVSCARPSARSRRWTRMAGRPSDRTTRRSAYAWASCSSPSEYGRPGTGTSRATSPVIWRNAPLPGPPLWYWPTVCR